MALTYTRLGFIDNTWSATATGTGNIAETLAPGVNWELREIRLHLSANGGANNFTATMDAGAGAAYDAVILTQDMTSISDLSETWEPEEKRFRSDDELDFAWTNANARTYGLEIIYKVL
jgi:hypothetical protein